MTLVQGLEIYEDDPKWKRVYWRFSDNVCNYRCSYCCVKFQKSITDQDKPFEFKEESLSQVSQFVDLNFSGYHVHHLVLADLGEPTIIPGFRQLFELLSKKESSKMMETITNFSCDESYWNELVSNDSIRFRITASYHPEYAEGFIKKIITFRKRHPNVEIKVVVVVNDMNYKSQFEVVRILDKLRIHRVIEIDNLIGRGKYELFMRELLEIRISNGDHVDDYVGDEKTDVTNCVCGRGSHVIGIDVNTGKIHNCVYQEQETYCASMNEKKMKIVYGNLYDDTPVRLPYSGLICQSKRCHYKGIECVPKWRIE